MNTVLNHPLFVPLAVTIVIIAVFPLVAGYLTLVERKVLADFQVRLGPMRVGPHGLLQPIADALKLMLKEDIIPTDADQSIFWIAPMISTFTALTSFAVLPFSQYIFVADVNVGILVILAMSSVGILGIILGGWASNSHYPLLGALRSAAQLVSYEVALSFALLSGLMVAGTLSMQGIIKAQQERHIWFIAEYCGFRWALYFLAEYANIFVVSSVAVTLFWGGWLRPFPNVAWLEIPVNVVFPFLLFFGSGASCFVLLKKLKDPVQQKTLVGAAILCMLLGLPFLIGPV